ncbi:MAG: branched-chain amino acid transport system substrate-binding protein [Ilumatobacter sp.]
MFPSVTDEMPSNRLHPKPIGENMRTSRIQRSVAGIMAAGLIFAACGSDDATPAATEAPAETEAPADEAPAETEAPADEAPAETDAPAEALALEGDVEVAAGTTLALGDCPDDWSATQGVDGDEIRIGQTLPQSGALAAFGAIGGGMQMYFDFINDTDPIEGKNLVLIAKDDGYEAGRAVANVEEMLDSDDVFALAHNIGTPINFAIRPITDEACVPQLFNSSGFPFWGDPANFPWTVGNILNYVTETEIWCTDVKANIGEDATVAALIMNNDFGKTYQQTLNESEACAGLNVVSEQVHDPAGADVTNEMTTLAATDADVFLAGTTAKFCSQATAVLAASTWRPTTYMSYTCNNLASYFAPVQDAVVTLAADNAGPILANSNKICGDPAYADDPAVIEIERVLSEYGNVTCADGSYSTGYLYGEFLVGVLRSASELEGGLNRVNLMAAMWNADTSSDLLLGGTLKLDGVNDAYWTESAQLQQVSIVDGELAFVATGDLVDFEGQGGAYGS